MKISSLGFLGLFSGTVAIFYQPSYAANRDFFCGMKDGVPVTYAAYQDGQRKPIIRWVYNPSPGLTPLKRCQEVSQRFQRNYDNGNLHTLISDTYEGTPVICAAKNNYDYCTRNTLLFTIKPGDNPKEVLKRLLDPYAFDKGIIPDQSNGSNIFIDFKTYFNHLKSERPNSNSSRITR